MEQSLAAIPTIGLGTYRLEDETAYKSVLSALNLGYRHIDTATRYKNELQVGKAIKASGIPRSQIWITTKVPMELVKKTNCELHILKSIKKSLESLGTDYIDLLLLHAPVHERSDPKHMEKNIAAWKVLEKMMRGEIEDLKGKIRVY